jgi:signal transduction histidine kinase
MSSHRYRQLLKRTLGCCGVGILAAGAHLCGALAPIENTVLSWFIAGVDYGSSSIAPPLQALVIVSVCLAPAIVRIEQPLVLIACGAALAFIYYLIVSVLLLTSDITLPVSATMLGLCGAVALQETLAWSEERRRRQALESLEQARQQFTDMLVHDLKRRMSSILMALSVLEKTNAEETQRRGTLTTTIRASAERLLLLTGNLLDIRKMEERHFILQREPINLAELVQECLKEHRGACELTGVRVCTTGGGNVRANADRGVLRRVLANLLWNALQHAPEGSCVEIGYAWAGERVVLHVANHGAPLAADERGQLFTAFVSNTAPPANSLVASTGLGLTFCKLAVEAHGGDIALESPWPGQADGVRVVLRLPAAR